MLPAVVALLLAVAVVDEDLNVDPPQPAIKAAPPPPKPTRNARRLKTLVSDPPRFVGMPRARLPIPSSVRGSGRRVLGDASIVLIAGGQRAAWTTELERGPVLEPDGHERGTAQPSPPVEPRRNATRRYERPPVRAPLPPSAGAAAAARAPGARDARGRRRTGAALSGDLRDPRGKNPPAVATPSRESRVWRIRGAGPGRDGARLRGRRGTGAAVWVPPNEVATAGATAATFGYEFATSARASPR